MESKLRFVQDRTISVTISGSTGTATIPNIPFAVDKILFKYLGVNHNASETLLIQSDLIYNNTIAVFQANKSASYAPINNEFVFQTPVKIGGLYNFMIKDSALALDTTLNTKNVVIVAQFIRE